MEHARGSNIPREIKEIAAESEMENGEGILWKQRF